MTDHFSITLDLKKEFLTFDIANEDLECIKRILVAFEIKCETA